MCSPWCIRLLLVVCCSLTSNGCSTSQVAGNSGRHPPARIARSEERPSLEPEKPTDIIAVETVGYRSSQVGEKVNVPENGMHWQSKDAPSKLIPTDWESKTIPLGD